MQRRSMQTSPITASLGLVLALCLVLPAGAPEPSRIRVATLGGTSGAVYYSVPDGRFQFIVPLEERGTAALDGTRQ